MTASGLSDLRGAFLRAFAVALPIVALAAIAAALASGRNLVPVAGLGLLFAGIGLAALFSMGPTTTARQVSSAALMGLVALLVLATAGTAWQIDMHMAFFAALAVVAGWCCWQTIVVGDRKSVV
jgi:methyl-accepting chemotaxis protein